MADLSNKEMQRNRMLAYFIEATQSIIEQEGIEHISIRKVAQKAGFNSATIYHYFKDVDQLILLASMRYLKNYNVSLSKHINEQIDSFQQYLDLWGFFCEASFEYPKVIYNLFFNHHSVELGDIVTQYYSVFPEETESFSPAIAQIMVGQTVLDRNRGIMEPLVIAGYIREDELEMINYITICCFRNILSDKCDCKEADSKELKERMRAIITYLMVDRKNTAPN